MMKRLQLLGLSVTMAILGGCYPNGPEQVNDLDIVVTHYDKEFGFESARLWFQ